MAITIDWSGHRYVGDFCTRCLRVDSRKWSKIEVCAYDAQALEAREDKKRKEYIDKAVEEVVGRMING